jgi:hypothetical protein
MKSVTKGMLSVSLLMIFGLISISFFRPSSSYIPPQGYTGVTANTCRNCHSGNPLNNVGGGVLLSGLPVSGYLPDNNYDLSITISHVNSDRRRWGFSIIALNLANQPVGSFSSINPNAGVNGNELSHKGSVVTAGQANYTYQGLSWKAPNDTSGNNRIIRFYFVGNAGDYNLSSSGDFIYTSTLAVAAALPPCTTNSWTGIASDAWEDPSNWSCGVLPDSTMDVVIGPNANIQPVVKSNAICKSLTQSSGKQIIIVSGYKLNILGKN